MYSPSKAINNKQSFFPETKMWKKILLLLLLPGAAADYTSAPHSSDPREGGWMELEGSNMIQVPAALWAEANWTYPFRAYPAYEENESISCTFWGAQGLAGRNASLCISDFGIADLLLSLVILNGSINLSGRVAEIRLNQTGDAAVSLRGQPAGLYNLYLLDELNRTILSASPLLVTESVLDVELPENLSAGQILPVNINSSGPTGNYTLGALILSQQSYRSARLELYSNGTLQNLTAIFTLGNQTMELQYLPKEYEKFLNEILSILPEDSSAAVQESSRPQARLYLLTDPDWQRGKYMLICAVYSSGQGIVAIRQSVIEVV